MNPITRLILFIFVSAFALTLTAWMRGNENMYTYERRVQINPLEMKNIKNYDPNYDYFKEYYLVDVVKPSSIPGLFTTKTDTISMSLVTDLR